MSLRKIATLPALRAWSLSTFLALLGFLALLSWASPSLAHEIWLERQGNQLSLHFGEYGSNLKEASPGYLDKIIAPNVWTVDRRGNQPASLQRQARGFAISPASPGFQSLLVEDRSYPLLTSDKGGKRWTPAARYLTNINYAATPQLTLDIVPTGKAGEFQAVYRGKPLAGAELTLTAQSGWSVSKHTSQDGKATFSFPWRGGYLLHMRHTDESPGTRKTQTGTEDFAAQSFSTTVAFELSQGLPAVPRPTPLPPNQPPPEKK